VLRCLAAGLSRREIGAAALLSLNTVKTHLRELYRNLDVTSPADAVVRPPALRLRDLSESPG
jgi:LuxR family maltose regulon positive regulatory protein